MLAIDLSGKIALVTGSSGQLGRVMAVTLAKAGADVAVHYNRNRESAEKVGKEIAKLGRKFCLITGDVSDEAAIKAELASNGVDVNTGSAKTVETSAREEEQLNTLNVANKAALQVYGYRAQQENFLAEESRYKSEAEEAPIAGLLGGAGGLLGAAKGFGGAGLFGSQTPSSSNGPGLGS